MNGILILFIVALLCTLIGGVLIGYFIGKPHKVGSFTINYTDPKKDLCQLELKEDLDRIDKLKKMTLDVIVIR